MECIELCCGEEEQVKSLWVRIEGRTCKSDSCGCVLQTAEEEEVMRPSTANQKQS